MPCPPLLVGFRAMWPLVGFSLRRGSKQARAIDPHQECPPWRSPLAQPRGGTCSSSGSTPTRGLTPQRYVTAPRLSSASYESVRIDGNETGCSSSLPASRPVRGPSSRPAGWARCSPSSWSLPASRCWMCRRPCRLGSGCSIRVAPTRPTRTMRGRRRSSRCGTADCARSPRWITPRCCACSPIGTTTSPGCAPRRSVGFTPCSVA
jgi:hypothetical protein